MAGKEEDDDDDGDVMNRHRDGWRCQWTEKRKGTREDGFVERKWTGKGRNRHWIAELNATAAAELEKDAREKRYGHCKEERTREWLA